MYKFLSVHKLLNPELGSPKFWIKAEKFQLSVTNYVQIMKLLVTLTVFKNLKEEENGIPDCGVNYGRVASTFGRRIEI